MLVETLPFQKMAKLVTLNNQLKGNNNGIIASAINVRTVSKLFNLDQMGQPGNKPWTRGDYFEAKINFDSQLLPTSGVYTKIDYA